tara:strand:+ start:368 stop:691 length:324 start_codon:yes stop_codon:yes gene_type:complete
MPEQVDKGRLWLFTNTYKKTDAHPAWTGSGEISGTVIKELAKWYNDHKADLKDGCVELTCAAWPKESKKDGKPYHFVTFEIKKPREANSIPEGGVASTPSEDEDIPF